MYLKDDDGRICVAPEALSIVEEHSHQNPDVPSVMLSTPIDPRASAITPSTFRQAGTPLQQRLQNLSITTVSQLSPFRASLFRLKASTLRSSLAFPEDANTAPGDGTQVSPVKMR